MPGGRRTDRSARARVIEPAIDVVGAAVASGRSGAIVVSGDPGVGKTYVLSQIVAETSSRDVVTVLDAAEQWEVQRPFSAVRNLARFLTSGVHDEDVVPLEDRPQHAAIDAIVEGLEKVAVERPVLVAVDDLQWIDTASAGVLAAVVRRLSHLPVVVAVAARPPGTETPGGAALALLAEVGAARVHVEPLADADVDAIAAEVLGAPPGPGLRKLLVRAGGNPLLVVQMLHLLRDEGDIVVASGAADTVVAEVPRRVHAVVLRHLAFLSEPTQRLLRVASVLGASFSMSELAALADERVARLIAPVEEAVRAGVLSLRGDVVRFTHDLVREALYDDLAPAVRAGLHDEAWRALLAAGGSAARAAHHVVRAGSISDPQAVEVLLATADELRVSDPGGAVALLDPIASGSGPFAERATRKLISLLAHAGDVTRAEEMARSYLAGALSPEGRAEVYDALLHVLFSQGRWTEVIDVADKGLDERLGDVATARIVAQRAMARMWIGDPLGAERDAKMAVTTGRAAHDSIAISLGLAHRSVVAANSGQFTQAIGLARASVAAAASAGPEHRIHPQISVGMAHFASGDLHTARAELARARRFGDASGARWDLPLHNAMLAIPSLFLGEWDQAVAECETSLALEEETGSAHGRMAALGILALVAARRGDTEEADRRLGEAARLLDDGPRWGTHFYGLAMARRAAEAHPRRAVKVLEFGFGLAAQTGNAEGIVLFGPPLVRAALAADDVALAASAARAVMDVGGERPPHVEAAVLLCRGVLDDDPGAIVAAIERLRATSRAPEAALACVDGAVSMVRRGDRDGARRLFAEASATFDALAAAADASEGANRLAAAGLRVRGPKRAARPSFGWEALTKTELQVARLAAEGLTNPAIGERLFISRSTVQTHLAHIFTKLGLSSRVELAAEVVRRST